MTVWIADWTHWQGAPLPAARVQSEGYGMVKLKAGGRNNPWHFEDPTFNLSASALHDTSMIPGVFWYLAPGRATAQAGLFYDMLEANGGVRSWAAYVDVEQIGLRWEDYDRFVRTWAILTGGQKLTVYSNRNYWINNMGSGNGAAWAPVLEDAHWVAQSVRESAATPYASQQAKAIDPAWWHASYGGWAAPTILQFTDAALVAGVRTSASLYRGSKDALRALLMTS